MIKITDVNYIDLENKMIEVKEVHIPSNINKEIDGRNKYILPGLVDMHTHITPNNAKHYLYSGVTSVRNTGGNYELIEHIDSISPKPKNSQSKKSLKELKQQFIVNGTPFNKLMITIYSLCIVIVIVIISLTVIGVL